MMTPYNKNLFRIFIMSLCYAMLCIIPYWLLNKFIIKIDLSSSGYLYLAILVFMLIWIAIAVLLFTVLCPIQR